jgi:hypothetical protein
VYCAGLGADSGADIVPVLVPTSVPDSGIGTSVPTLDWKVYKGHERLVESEEARRDEGKNESRVEDRE